MGKQKGASLLLDEDRGEARGDLLAAASAHSSKPAIPIASQRFNYSTLASDVAKLATSTAEKIRQHQRRTVVEIIDIGGDLVRVKAVLEHGHFGTWLERECGWSERTAQRYMRAAVAFGNKPDTVSDLPPALVYKLAAPSIPDNVRLEIVDQLALGESLHLDQIAEKVEGAQRLAREAQRASKLTKKQRQSRASRQKKDERRREQFQQEEQARQNTGRTIAERLVSDFGLETVTTIAAALEDLYVTEAVRVLIRPHRQQGGGHGL